MNTNFLLLSLALGIYFAAAHDCPESHFLVDNRCFAFVHERVEFEEARKECAKMGYDLVSIHDMISNHYAQQLAHIALGSMYGSFWIGLFKERETWKWVDSTLIDYTNWAWGNNPAKKCATMRISDGKWITADCETS
ncbi:unnamed protein product [Strongylus vulgaris]|uniref:C-type lectin domain-containing protein n=1 Tax=Strongylus vulgaris TaxID=40348 RepID=A0A3P7ITW8_STRVU|nr:unnamed protein product [Strongylus vulgaris]